MMLQQQTVTQMVKCTRQKHSVERRRAAMSCSIYPEHHKTTLTVRGLRIAPRLCCVWLCLLSRQWLPISCCAVFSRVFHVPTLASLGLFGIITGPGCILRWWIWDAGTKRYSMHKCCHKCDNTDFLLCFSPSHAAENLLQIGSVRVLWVHHLFFIRLNISDVSRRL